jgi:hypothetical protein
MRRPLTPDGQGPIDSSRLRPNTSRSHRTIRKHNGDLRCSIWTRRYNCTRIGRRGGGLRRKSGTSARQRYIRLAFHVSYRQHRLTYVLYTHLTSEALAQMSRSYQLRGSYARTLAPSSYHPYLPIIDRQPCDRLEVSRNNYPSCPPPPA